MKEEFYDFLKSSKPSVVINYGTKSKAMINKIQYNQKLDILYMLNNYGGNLFDLKSAFKYAGIYDKENDKLYDLEYTLRNDILGFDYASSEKYMSYTLYKNISQEVNKRIKELITIDDVDNLFDISDIEISELLSDEDVITDFMNGITSKTLDIEINDYKTEKADDLLDYLTNKNEFIERASREYVLSNTSYILESLKIIDEKRKILKSIENNKNHIFHKIRDIVNSIDDRCSTVNLTININGIEQTLKYKADVLKRNYNSSYLSTWYIDNRLDREKFETNYGRNMDLHYEDIVKITYSKKTLYEDKNFHEKVKEEESELSK